MRRVLLAVTTLTVVLSVAIAVSGCAGDEQSADGADQDLGWVDTALTDAVTGETFRISDFAGEPVLVEGFANW
jgi:hypothetical protein